MSRPLALVVLGAAACSPTAVPDAPTSAFRLGPALPRRALEPGVTALGQGLVVAGGFDTGPAEGQDVTARVDELDTTAGAWLLPGTLPDAPVRWIAPNLGAIGSTLYLAGGLEGPGRVARGDAFALDPVDHTWHALPAMPPGKERGASGVVTAPGKIYLLGGATATAAVASCLAYDIVTRTWSELPLLPAPRAHPAAMRRSDGTLIVAGGFAGADMSEPRDEVWGLPLLGKAWLPLAPMHPPGGAGRPRGGCAYGVVLGQLVCAGGSDGRAASREVGSYDPYNDRWMTAEPMPAARTGTPGAAIGGRLYVPGGSETLALEPTDTLYVYAPLDTQVR